MASGAAGAGLGAFGGAVGGASIEAGAIYNQRVANANADMLEIQSQRTEAKGEVDAENFRNQVNQTKGQQRVGYAAGNIAVDSGSASEIQEQTAVLGAKDAQTIRNNAYLEALGLKSQAINVRGQGEFGLTSAKNQAFGSIVTGGLSGFTSAGGAKDLGTMAGKAFSSGGSK